MLRRLVNLLLWCETFGLWPSTIRLVIIVSLPKPDGGRRDIGLLPLLPRIWMRARRYVVKLWERTNLPPWIYAEVGNGADIAAWRQSANVEAAAAAAAALKVGYAQALLDRISTGCSFQKREAGSGIGSVSNAARALPEIRLGYFDVFESWSERLVRGAIARCERPTTS